MNTEKINIEPQDAKKLLGAASGDATLLYLYIRCGNDVCYAGKALSMTETRFNCAVSTLRQLGLWTEERKETIIPGQRPAYAERDVLDAMNDDNEFKLLYGEVQRLLGRNLNTEELKILLSFIRYLGFPVEVISLLVCYCKERGRQKGNLRNPSLRTIEKEAYHWAELGIDTLEEAAAYIQNQNVRNSRLSNLMRLLQIRGRNLTQAEERYAAIWLDMGLPDELISMAYEKTCVNTGNMNWPYMNKILTSWHTAGYKTAEQVRSGDRKPDGKTDKRQLDAEEKEAIARLLLEE